MSLHAHWKLRECMNKQNPVAWCLQGMLLDCRLTCSQPSEVEVYQALTCVRASHIGRTPSPLSVYEYDLVMSSLMTQTHYRLGVCRMHLLLLVVQMTNVVSTRTCSMERMVCWTMHWIMGLALAYRQRSFITDVNQHMVARYTKEVTDGEWLQQMHSPNFETRILW